jgi:hypothetical protein
MKESIPVLILAFIRPVETKQLVESLVNLGVSKFYISIDGPRNSVDAATQSSMRNEIEIFLSSQQVEWQIQQSRFNLGVRKGVLNGLDWFFQNEERGMILEDDLVIDHCFLEYCDRYLGEISQSDLIWMISGMQLLDEFTDCATPILSNYPMIWGWATTSKKWQEMRESLENLKPLNPRRFGIQRSYFWNRGLERVNSEVLDTWDLPLALAFIWEKRFCLISNQNLVKNIGYGSTASHTAKAGFPLNHPIGKLDSSVVDIQEIDYSVDYDRLLEIKVFKFKKVQFFFGLLFFFFHEINNFKSKCVKFLTFK